MKAIKIGKILIIIGVLFYYAENMYFGWNLKPMSQLEKALDGIVVLLISLGIGFFLIPITDLYIEAVKRMDENKKK